MTMPQLDPRLTAAAALQHEHVQVDSNMHARMTIAMRLEDAAWAADAHSRGQDLPVVLTGLTTAGRVIDTGFRGDDRTVMHATIEVDL
jgi:hypothetical protein